MTLETDLRTVGRHQWPVGGEVGRSLGASRVMSTADQREHRRPCCVAPASWGARRDVISLRWPAAHKHAFFDPAQRGSSPHEQWQTPARGERPSPRRESCLRRVPRRQARGPACDDQPDGPRRRHPRGGMTQERRRVRVPRGEDVCSRPSGTMTLLVHAEPQQLCRAQPDTEPHEPAPAVLVPRRVRVCRPGAKARCQLARSWGGPAAD